MEYEIFNKIIGVAVMLSGIAKYIDEENEYII